MFDLFPNTGDLKHSCGLFHHLSPVCWVSKGVVLWHCVEVCTWEAHRAHWTCTHLDACSAPSLAVCEWTEACQIAPALVNQRFRTIAWPPQERSGWQCLSIRSILWVSYVLILWIYDSTAIFTFFYNSSTRLPRWGVSEVQQSFINITTGTDPNGNFIYISKQMTLRWYSSFQLVTWRVRWSCTMQPFGRTWLPEAVGLFWFRGGWIDGEQIVSAS